MALTIKPLCPCRDVRNTEVTREDDDQEREMDPGHADSIRAGCEANCYVGIGQEYLERCKDSVERVFADVVPAVICRRQG